MSAIALILSFAIACSVANFFVMQPLLKRERKVVEKMKLLKSSQAFTVEIVELSRNCWKVAPPQKLEVALIVFGIVSIAILWGVFS